jgi:hypothetical protein
MRGGEIDGSDFFATAASKFPDGHPKIAQSLSRVQATGRAEGAVRYHRRDRWYLQRGALPRQKDGEPDPARH